MRSVKMDPEVTEDTEEVVNGLRGEIERTGHVVDAALKVHSALGPGLLENAYEACLAHELRSRGFAVSTQLALPVTYDGLRIDVGYRLDLLVDDAVVVEIKAVTSLAPIHQAQLLSYLRLGDYPAGLLINFHAARLRDGIRRLLNGYRPPP